MHAYRKPAPVAQRLQQTSDVRRAEQSPEQSPSGTSGTYFRAVRSTAAEAGAVASGASVIDCAKVEGLRFELEVGVWQRDSERIAQCVIDDAECPSVAGTDDE